MDAITTLLDIFLAAFDIGQSEVFQIILSLLLQLLSFAV